VRLPELTAVEELDAACDAISRGRLVCAASLCGELFPAPEPAAALQADLLDREAAALRVPVDR